MIYEHPFHKMVNDGVLVKTDKGDESVNPRDILGTWDEHLNSRQRTDQIKAEEHRKSQVTKRRDEKNLNLLQMLCEQDRTYDFEPMRRWLKNPNAALPITPRDIYRMVNAMYGLKMFDVKED